MENNVRQDTPNPNTVRIDARSHQLDLLKVERRGMRPMALTVLNRGHSTKAKLAAVAGVAAMLVALNTTSEAYAAKLNLKPAVAEQSALVLQNAVACCDQLAEFITVGAPETALKGQIVDLFGLIDAEHKRLEAFADSLGARLFRAGGQPAPEGDPDDTDVGTGGGKESSLWLSRANVNAEVESDPDGETTDVGTGGGKESVAWLSQVKMPALSDLPSLFR